MYMQLYIQNNLNEFLKILHNAESEYDIRIRI